MELYQSLQTVLNKIKDNNDLTGYESDNIDKLYCIMKNQEHLSDALLVIASLLQALIEREINVQVIPANGEKTH